MRHPICTAIVLGIYCLPALAAEAVVSPLSATATNTNTAPYSDTLFGDPSGKRSAMLAQGYDLEVIYKLDFLNNLSRNREKIYVLDNLDIKLAWDGEKAAGIKGASAFLHILSNRGDKPGAHSNRLPHGVDNIETPQNGNTSKIFQAWLQQSFLDERVSVLAGLYDLNSEFYATESSAIICRQLRWMLLRAIPIIRMAPMCNSMKVMACSMSSRAVFRWDQRTMHTTTNFLSACGNTAQALMTSLIPMPAAIPCKGLATALMHWSKKC
jgi:hypothetical protein